MYVHRWGTWIIFIEFIDALPNHSLDLPVKPEEELPVSDQELWTHVWTGPNLIGTIDPVDELTPDIMLELCDFAMSQ